MTDLKDKAIKFKGSEYIQVKDRILYLANEVKDYSIETDYQYFPEQKMWVVKAKLTIPYQENVANTIMHKERVYTGLAQEVEDTSFINKTSALENAETSAVGRACAMAGIGVIDSIASIDEINKANNRPQEPIINAATGEVFSCDSCKGSNVKHLKGISKAGKPYDFYKCQGCGFTMN